MADKIAVVIPCYKVRLHIISVLEQIDEIVSKIYIVDDCCPERTADYVEAQCNDRRVVIIRHMENQGVGGAVMSGYKYALDDGMNIIVKIDGDGQIDPKLIPDIIRPILSGDADYTKGNRFYDIESLKEMPKIRLFGNAVLSFMTKLSSGYWDIFDPTNGFTAIHSTVAKHLPFNKISKRYFFETDILFRLNTIRAVVIDVPMIARYGDEISNLKINKILWEFLYKHLRNCIKRIFYNYYLRDMSIASIELPMGMLLITYGSIFGVYHWATAHIEKIATPAGTVMLAALPILIGLQLIISFLSYDISSVPRRPLHILRFNFENKRIEKDFY